MMVMLLIGSNQGDCNKRAKNLGILFTEKID